MIDHDVIVTLDAGSGLGANLNGALPSAPGKQGGPMQLNGLGNFALHCFLASSDEDEHEQPRQPNMAPGLRSPQMLCA